MNIRVLQAPGGLAGVADRISFLLRKKCTLVDKTHRRSHPVVHVPNMTNGDIKELKRNGVMVMMPVYNHPGSPWFNPMVLS